MEHYLEHFFIPQPLWTAIAACHARSLPPLNSAVVPLHITLQLLRFLGGPRLLLDPRVDGSATDPGVVPASLLPSISPSPPAGAATWPLSCFGLTDGLLDGGLRDGDPLRLLALSNMPCSGVDARLLLPVTGVLARLPSGVVTGLRFDSDARASCSFCVSRFFSFVCSRRPGSPHA